MLLTRVTDNLGALSGLAKEVQRSLASNYIAGIREDNFSRSLLWQVVPGKVHKRPSQYRGPTWSWISLDGPIKYPAASQYLREGILDIADDETCAKPIHSSVIPVAKDPMVQLLSASLILSGYLGMAAYSEEFEFGKKALYTITSPQRPLGKFEYDIESEVTTGQPIFCFYILPGTGHLGYISGEYPLIMQNFTGLGLALAKVEGEANQYRRLGIVTGVSRRWFKSHPRSLISII
jgi:hypothetical protein